MFEILITGLFLVIGYFVGSSRERKHIAHLQLREHQLLTRLPARTDRGPRITSGETFLVTSNVVIASDYFKNFVGNLRNFFGGRLTTHETLLDRARREALCRLREKAMQAGAHEIVNLRTETVFIDQLGIEVSAYGTAVRK